MVSLSAIPTAIKKPEKKPFSIAFWISAKNTGPIKTQSSNPNNNPLMMTSMQIRLYFQQRRASFQVSPSSKHVGILFAHLLYPETLANRRRLRLAIHRV